jgi:malate dehydrogenase (oxaloacetate-decarboxylating)
MHWIVEHTNRAGYVGDLRGAVADADVFIGVSAPGILTGDDVATMAKDAIVFALANPVPEVDPAAASEHAAVVATGAATSPTRSTTCSRSRGCSAACSTRTARRSRRPC